MLQKDLYCIVSVLVKNIKGGENSMKDGIIQIRITNSRKKSWKEYAEKMGIPLTSLIIYAMSRFMNEENLQ